MLYLFNKIKNSAFEQIFWILIGMALPKIFKLIKGRIISIIQHRCINKYKVIQDSHLNTLTLGSGIPNYESQDIIFRKTSNKLFVSFPKELISELDDHKRNSYKSEDVSFNGTNSFTDLVEETKISNLQA